MALPSKGSMGPFLLLLINGFSIGNEGALVGVLRGRADFQRVTVQPNGVWRNYRT